MATTTLTATAGPSTIRRPAGRRIRSDTFRPQFPLDPFAHTKQSTPWLLDVDALLSCTHEPRRQVVLVLGEPSHDSLYALLRSPILARSLLILASDSGPALSADVRPTVRMLRSSAEGKSLSAANLGSVLHWAERIARVWRKHGGTGTRELTDDDDGRGYADATSRAPLDPAHRALDAIVHFLPRGAPDKELLRQVVFVAGMAQPFLMSSSKSKGKAVGSSASTRSLESAKRARRPSLLKVLSSSSVASLRSRRASSPLASSSPAPSSSSSSSSSLPERPHTAAHLVHVLPPTPSPTAYTRLTANIESFLLALTAPSPSPSASPSFPASPSSSPNPPLAHTPSSRPRAYITTAPAFASPIRPAPGDADVPWTVTIGDAILCGALDGDIDGDVATHGSLAARYAPPRAFVRAEDVVAGPAATPREGIAARARVQAEGLPRMRDGMGVDVGVGVGVSASARTGKVRAARPTAEGRPFESGIHEDAPVRVEVMHSGPGVPVGDAGVGIPPTSEGEGLSEVSGRGEKEEDRARVNDKVMETLKKRQGEGVGSVREKGSGMGGVEMAVSGRWRFWRVRA